MAIIKETYNRFIFISLIPLIGVFLIIVFLKTSSPQTSKYHYILFCYYLPFAKHYGHTKYLEYDQKFTGTWFDWNKNGSLAYSTELKDGNQNGRKIVFPNNKVISDGFVLNNLFTGIEYEYDKPGFCDITKKYLKNNNLIAKEIITAVPKSVEKQYFELDVLTKCISNKDEKFSLQTFNKGHLAKSFPDIVEFFLDKFDFEKNDVAIKTENEMQYLETKFLLNELALEKEFTFQISIEFSNPLNLHSVFSFDFLFTKGTVNVLIYKYKNKRLNDEKEFLLKKTFNAANY